MCTVSVVGARRGNQHCPRFAMCKTELAVEFVPYRCLSSSPLPYAPHSGQVQPYQGQWSEQFSLCVLSTPPFTSICPMGASLALHKHPRKSSPMLCAAVPHCALLGIEYRPSPQNARQRHSELHHELRLGCTALS